MQAKLEAEINDKVRELELLRAKISSLSDPTLVESTIAKLDVKRNQLILILQQAEEENISKKKAVTDEIQMALSLIQDYEVAKTEQLENMNAYINQRKRECEETKLLDA